MQISYVHLGILKNVVFSQIYWNITDYSRLFGEIQPGVQTWPKFAGARTDSVHFPKKDIDKADYWVFFFKTNAFNGRYYAEN